MSDRISRRDFLNGVAVTIGAGLAIPEALRAAESSSGDYPPALAGMRGSTDVSYAGAHALRDGKKFAITQLPVEGTVDLVVIGAGISGLAAAYYFRKRKPNASILLLDNHDDFGGHARRCEMHVDGRLILGYGGSEAIQSPANLWSEGALALLEDLGVDLEQFETAFDRTLYPGLGLSRGMLFTKEAFGVDKLVTGDPTRMVADDIPPTKLNARTPAQFIGDFPLPEASRRQLIALYTEKREVLPGKNVDEKQEILGAISYRDFLTHHWGLDAKAADTFQKRPHDFYALGIDAIPALDLGAIGYPGFQGLGLPPDAEAQAEMDEPYIYHFPDGNASLARLLVRRLIPGVAPGSTMQDVVTAAFDYSKLDATGAKTRLRLNSTVVTLANLAGNNRNAGVDIGYLRDGKLHRVQATHAIHAGYNMMLPYMMGELAKPQRDALAAGVKAPLVYAKVALRSWEPWVKAGVHEVTNPMGFFSRIKLDYPVSLGAYQFPKSPREPIGVHMVHVPTPANAGDERAAWRAGRAILYATTFAQFEAKLTDELTRILGPSGFDAKRDIAAIDVFRWGHGYAYGFNSLFDKEVEPEVPVVARKRVGRIAIANSDAAWEAYAHAAIDQAARAVEELRKT
jgi:spermidine dehydrogenase